jgi:hypothetical protein
MITGSIGVQRMARQDSPHEEAARQVLEDKVAKHQQASSESVRRTTLSGMQKKKDGQASPGTNALKERETSISHDHLERYLKDTVRRSLCCIWGSGVLGQGVRRCTSTRKCRRTEDGGGWGGGGGAGAWLQERTGETERGRLPPALSY